MKKYIIEEVQTPLQARLFLEVPVAIYKGDSNWVRPLDSDIEAVFDPMKNERFADGQAARWLLFEGERAVGRIAAFFTRSDSAKESQPTGGCGFFEAPDDMRAARLLFDAAKDWLASHGMEAMDGSINFGERMHWWGVLAEGFTQPVYGMNYNPPYYTSLFEQYGFLPYFNQHSYLRCIDPEIVMEDALYQKAERMFENPEFRFTTFDKKNKEQMALDFMEVYNSAWAKFEGVTPLTVEHAMELMRQMVPIIDTSVFYMAYHNDKPAGFFVMLPDLNRIIGRFNGKFGLWQKLQLLWALKVSKKIDRLNGLIFGVSAEHQGKGVESAMIRQFEIYTQQKRKAGKEQYKTLEMGWIGDFNPVMMRMCEGYVKAVKWKRHITYRYLFDRNKPFSRCPRLGKNR